MEETQAIAETITISDSSQLVLGFTIVTIAVLMALESILPRRKLERNIGGRWFNNISLSIVTYYVSMLLNLSVQIHVIARVDLANIGLLQKFPIGTIPSFIVLLLAAQFVSYWVHRMYHTVPAFWRFHAVHHNDVDVDVTTSYRHHPLEPIVSLPVILPVFVIVGAPTEAGLWYQLTLIGVSYFSHSNVRLPKVLDKLLSYVIITPDFHRTHHCSEREFTDSNYGGMLTWYDHLFGTAKIRNFDDQETMQTGLEYLREPRDSRVDQLLWTPLKKWR